MVNYIGIKKIKAEPMTRGDYNKFRGWNIPENENPNDKGELSFVPACPRSTYNMQIKSMADYIAVLEARAVMEGIDLWEV